MHVQKLKEIFRFSEIMKLHFLITAKRKNLFLFTCIVLDPDIKLKEVDQNIPFGGQIEFGNFFLDYFFANSKNFRLNAFQ